MKTRLEDLTIAQFIDLVCGQADIILSKHEVAGEYDKSTIIRDIVLEYREIVDPVMAKQNLLRFEDLVTARLEVILFRMCSDLIDMNDHGAAREVLAVYGINAQAMTPNRIAAEVKSRLERARKKVADLQDESEKETPTPEEIRRQFDEQTANLMAHFRFQIDTTSMKATVYAHLVALHARHNKEMKARLAAMRN